MPQWLRLGHYVVDIDQISYVKEDAKGLGVKIVMRCGHEIKFEHSEEAAGFRRFMREWQIKEPPPPQPTAPTGQAG